MLVSFRGGGERALGSRGVPCGDCGWGALGGILGEAPGRVGTTGVKQGHLGLYSECTQFAWSYATGTERNRSKLS